MKWKCSKYINYSASISTAVGKFFQASNGEQWRWLCSIINKTIIKRQILRNNYCTEKAEKNKTERLLKII